MLLSEYRVEGMTCDGCRMKVAAALTHIGTDIDVSLDPPQARFSSERPVPFQLVAETVRAAGKYRVLPHDQPESRSASVTDGPRNAFDEPTGWLRTYRPLLLIFGYIIVASLAGASNGPASSGFSPERFMSHFMAGFFLTFSFFKFLDLKGFAESYAGYDILAKRVPAYGYLYPFLELVLGIAFLFMIAPVASLIATMVLMGFSSLGVIQALRRKQRIRCACLGTVLNLPMSTVTLIEDLLMVAMALAMLAAKA